MPERSQARLCSARPSLYTSSMSWFHQSPEPFETKHNGTMKLSRMLGKWTLWGHDGTYQAAPYMDGVWKKTVRLLLRRDLDVRHCLVLGVALGGTFGIVQKAWPDADIVGVDWEPALFELGKKIGIYRPDTRVNFIEGDAAEVVPALEGKFDLIIIDLFNGKKVADVVSDSAFQEAVAAHLAEDGIVAVNCYNQRPVFEGWQKRLGDSSFVRYSANEVGIFMAPKPA